MEQSNEPKESTDYSSVELINHSNLVLSNLESLYLNDEFSDITLVIDNSEIPAHKIILASSSDYFRALLFCGLQESQSSKISLKCSNERLFKQLLKYVYTGKMSLTEMSVQQILEIFQMSHEYNFKALNETISKHLISILSLKNVCIFYDLSNFYEIDELRTACLHFLDHNAEQVLKQENFLRLSKTNLKSILLRESFCANELSILVALNHWIKANPEEDGKVLYQQIRMNLIDLEQLIELIRPTELLNPDEILDLIYSTVKNKDKDYRCFTMPEVNIASERFETKVIHGELEILGSKKQSSNLNETGREEEPDEAASDREEEKELEHRAIVSNLIKPNEESCLLIQFKYPFKINLIKMMLHHKDDRTYSYYVETSLDAENWKRVVDHTAYVCRSGQFLYFESQVVKYVKVVGTACNNCDHLEVAAIECLYTEELFELAKGLIVPKSNVATLEKYAQVIEGVSRIKDVLLFGDSFVCDPDISFTCHQLGNGSITVQLSQPYLIGSIRFLLYDNDKRKYGYEVFVSVNRKNWIKVANDAKRNCRSWQTIKFEPLPVVFIRIFGTYCSASNQAFNLVRFECPASF